MSLAELEPQLWKECWRWTRIYCPSAPVTIPWPADTSGKPDIQDEFLLASLPSPLPSHTRQWLTWKQTHRRCTLCWAGVGRICPLGQRLSSQDWLLDTYYKKYALFLRLWVIDSLKVKQGGRGKSLPCASALSRCTTAWLPTIPLPNAAQVSMNPSPASTDIKHPHVVSRCPRSGSKWRAQVGRGSFHLTKSTLTSPGCNPQNTVWTWQRKLFVLTFFNYQVTRQFVHTRSSFCRQCLQTFPLPANSTLEQIFRSLHYILSRPYYTA